MPDGHPSRPSAFLDFALPEPGKDLLSFLIALRNQLLTGKGKLVFPRFDLGALIARAATADTLVDPKKIIIPAAIDIKPHLDNIGAILTNAIPIDAALGIAAPPSIPITASIGIIMALLKAGLHIPQIQNWLKTWGKGKALEWYRENSGDRIIETSNDTNILLRLQALSMWGNPQRAGVLIEDLLPRAFIADLLENMRSSNDKVVVFLDSFEALLDNADHGYRLLEMLTKYRRNGQPDPLLIVLGSQKPLFNMTTDILADNKSPQKVAQERLDNWSRQLPQNKSALGLRQLCLLLELPNFQLEDTRQYFAQRIPGLDNDEAILGAIQDITGGNPRYVAIAADAFLQAQMQGKTITANDVSSLKANGKSLQEKMLDLFLKQLRVQDRNEIFFWAVPRVIDAGTLCKALDLRSDVEARSRLNYYRDNFTFVHPVHPTRDQEYLVLSPEMRNLLLREFESSDDDYETAHNRLVEYFHNRATKGNEQAQIEEAYHSLALGQPDPAINYAMAAQQHNLAIWEPLLEAVAQARTKRLSEAIEQRAFSAYMLAKQQKDLPNSVTAIVLYTWMLVGAPV